MRCCQIENCPARYFQIVNPTKLSCPIARCQILNWRRPNCPSPSCPTTSGQTANRPMWCCRRVSFRNSTARDSGRSPTPSLSVHSSSSRAKSSSLQKKASSVSNYPPTCRGPARTSSSSPTPWPLTPLSTSGSSQRSNLARVCSLPWRHPPPDRTVREPFQQKHCQRFQTNATDYRRCRNPEPPMQSMPMMNALLDYRSCEPSPTGQVRCAHVQTNATDHRH